MRPLKPIWLLAVHLAWFSWIISFLFEFQTTEPDWKFLLIWMLNNRKCSFNIVEVYLQKHIQNPACKISKMVFVMKIVIHYLWICLVTQKCRRKCNFWQAGVEKVITGFKAVTETSSVKLGFCFTEILSEAV